MTHRSTDQRVDLWELDARDVLAAKTADNYLSHVTRFLDGRDPATITELDVRRWLRDRRDGGWSPGTQIYALRALRHFFAFAEQRHWVDANPTAAVPWPTDEERPVRAAGSDVERALMDAAEWGRDRAMIATLFGTGCRVGELARLRVSDVDVAEGTVLIARSKARRPRTVAVAGGERRAVLNKWLTVRLGRDVDHGALWLRLSDDEPLTQASVTTTFRRLARRAGVEFSPHDARRGRAEAWLAEGGSEVGLMRAAGWNSPAMVRRYSRRNGEQLAVDESRRLFG